MLSRRDIDPDALKVLYRLHQNNHLAYLVGGSVRDLLLGRAPKDFDIGTSAHPYQIKRLFRNCWIIGRPIPPGARQVRPKDDRGRDVPQEHPRPAAEAPAGRKIGRGGQRRPRRSGDGGAVRDPPGKWSAIPLRQAEPA
jgi:hypothetical protein